MKIETDLKKIKETAQKKEDENWEFRSFLKGYNMEVEELDSIVHRLFELVSMEIDCKACGNCCKEVSPTLDQADIERLVHGLGTGIDQFRRQFLVENDKNFSEGLIFNKKPCPLYSPISRNASVKKVFSMNAKENKFSPFGKRRKQPNLIQVTKFSENSRPNLTGRPRN